MHARSRLRPTMLGAVASLSLLGLAALPSAAARAAAAGGPADGGHSNVGAPHSPQLLRQLAGPLDAGSLARPGMSAALAAPALAPTGLPGAVQGIDVASFQHPVTTQYPGGAPISWSQVAGAGIQFAAIKATEGNYYVNPFYASDLAAASAAGIAPVGYAFANPKAGNGTAAQQAQYLVANAGQVGGSTPALMLDIEYNPYTGGECYGLTASAMVTWLSQFVTEATTLTGHAPIIYTTQDWWASCTGGSTAFGADPMWVADYTTAATPQPLPAGWGGWALWQYTSAGTVPGIATSGGTDLDALNLLQPGSQQATVGQAASLPLSQQLSAGAGTGLQYGATGLPAGLTISTGGLISGDPTVSGAAQATTVTATAAGSVLGSTGFTWNVLGPISVVTPASRKTVAGAAADFAVHTSGVPAGLTTSFTATGLPSGVTISAAGQIAGWPARAGSYLVALRATDSAGASAAASFSWTVTAAPDTGPVGPVTLDAHGMCLDDRGDKSANGTPVQTARCNGGAAQHWTLAEDGTLRIHGKCLAVAGSAASSGSKADIATCSGAASQHWAVRTGAELVNASAGKCLAGPASGASATAWIAGCTGKTNQKWTVPATAVMSQIPGGCLDDKSDSAADHTPVQVWACDGFAAQKWTARPDGTVRIHGKCLELNRSATAAKYPVDLATCTGGTAQRWQITADGAGEWLRNVASGRCLVDPVSAGGSFAAHPAVLTGACTASSLGASWRIR